MSREMHLIQSRRFVLFAGRRFGNVADVLQNILTVAEHKNNFALLS